MHQGHAEGMDSSMDNIPQVMGHDTTMQEHIPSLTTTSYGSKQGTPMMHAHSSNESIVELDAQIQFLQHQRQQQQQRQIQDQQRNYYAHNRIVPPTPNSLEMHGSQPQFYPQSDPQHQAMFDRYQMQVKEQEVSAQYLKSRLETH